MLRTGGNLVIETAEEDTEGTQTIQMELNFDQVRSR